MWTVVALQAVTKTVPLFHRDLGGAGKSPLVILHGMLGSSRNWQTAGRDLGERYHVLAPDLRNHGQSPHADDSSYEAMMDDVLAWMDTLKIAQATFLGHSMGGKVAMLLPWFARGGRRIHGCPSARLERRGPVPVVLPLRQQNRRFGLQVPSEPPGFSDIPVVSQPIPPA